MSKTFIITRASGGIGIQIVKRLIGNKAIVITAYVNEMPLDELKKNLPQLFQILEPTKFDTKKNIKVVYKCKK